MHELKSWNWSETHIPKEIRWKNRSLAKVFDVTCMNRGDWDKIRMADVILITGDAQCLPDDVKEFESWGIPHDLMAVNRSLVWHQRPVQHYTSIDNEESMWFAEYVSDKVLPPNRPLFRHTIGGCKGYDFCWIAGHPKSVDEYAKLTWAGNSGYFGILIAHEMGYKKVIIAGMPMDNTPHWYDPPETDGPFWVGYAYQQWMDYKIAAPSAERTRSMSGYTAFMLGKATKEWVIAP